jgi:hypothetical protein
MRFGIYLIDHLVLTVLLVVDAHDFVGFHVLLLFRGHVFLLDLMQHFKRGVSIRIRQVLGCIPEFSVDLVDRLFFFPDITRKLNSLRVDIVIVFVFLSKIDALNLLAFPEVVLSKLNCLMIEFDSLLF